ncbi:MAG: 2-oxoglutarate ferredoxin oxidoreductase subunit alpha [bacterium]|jgi:2-oxoglutarate ferredoxin oxidoreductase subunit alpha
MEATETSTIETLDKIVVRFAGDSGDGMQLTGNQFTGSAAIFGNDVATLPDFPAEIRAPAGTIAGLSGFQLQFGHTKVNTPGDYPDILVVMNPAALKANIKDVPGNGIIIIDKNSFTTNNLKKAGYENNPLETGELDSFRTHALPITSQTLKTLEDSPLPKKSKEKCKNFFTLGIVFWLFERSPDHTIDWLRKKFVKLPDVAEANIRALKEGMIYAQNSGMGHIQFNIQPAKLPPGKYKNITGNTAMALGVVAAGHCADLDVMLGGYPITPASDVLHNLATFKNFGVKTFQAEDEIAGITSAIGASYAGRLGVTLSSGPGIALKAEALGLAAMVELPLLVINVQRGGPSTGLPTKTEQSDLLQAMYGRNGECPMPVLAAKTPSDCFHMAIEAVRIAVKYMTPVFLLSDGYLGNGSEPFLIPNVDDLPDISKEFRTDPKDFLVYARDSKTLARDWVKAGTPGLGHRLGGLEKDFLTGNVSYDSENHERMVHIRQEKVDNIANDIADLEIYGDQDGGDVAIIGWGSTFGAIQSSVDQMRSAGKSVSHIHFTHLNPFPKNTLEVLKKFKTLVVAEMNLGQLSQMIGAKYALPVIPLNKVQGKPFHVREISSFIDNLE